MYSHLEGLERNIFRLWGSQLPWFQWLRDLQADEKGALMWWLCWCSKARTVKGFMCVGSLHWESNKNKNSNSSSNNNNNNNNNSTRRTRRKRTTTFADSCWHFVFGQAWLTTLEILKYVWSLTIFETMWSPCQPRVSEIHRVSAGPVGKEHLSSSSNVVGCQAELWEMWPWATGF